MTILDELADFARERVEKAKEIKSTEEIKKEAFPFWITSNEEGLRGKLRSPDSFKREK